MPFIALAVIVAAAGVAFGMRLRAPAGPPREAWPAIVLASVLVVAGHTATFLIAARSAGVTAPLSHLLPLTLLVLVAAALPNLGGWGPREGVTAWAFAAAGLGASLGVATAVAYGVMVFVASLPGAVVLLGELVSAARVREASDG
jgi:glycosyltransferase 2 family protein